MKKIFLFLLPVLTCAQITKVHNDSSGEHIGLRIIYFLGRVNGGVSLGKLPDVKGREYHQLIWTNRDYDKEEERTILTFQSTSDDINNLISFDLNDPRNEQKMSNFSLLLIILNKLT